MAETERYITSTLNRRDETVEKTLRPQKFEDFPGQDSVKERLKVYVEAAKRRNEPLGHLLLYGPPGLGKTVLSSSAPRRSVRKSSRTSRHSVLHRTSVTV